MSRTRPLPSMPLLPCLVYAVILACPVVPADSAHAADDVGLLLEDRFEVGAPGWQPVFEKGQWSVADGEFRCTGEYSVSGRVAAVKPIADAIVEADVRVTDHQRRRNFGFFVRWQDGQTGAAVRFYDRFSRLEVLEYHRGSVSAAPGGEKVAFEPGRWYRMKVALVGKMVLAKLYPADADEPSWQLVTQYPLTSPGKIGIFGEDGSQVRFRNVRIFSGPAIAQLKGQVAEERRRMAERVRRELQLEVHVRPFVLRTEQGPKREVYVRTTVDEKLHPTDGKLLVTYDGKQFSCDVSAEHYDSKGYPLPLPEPKPGEPKKLSLQFEAAVGKTLQRDVEIVSARRWKIFMNPHTHYDIGFTDPQPVIIERLARDMTDAIRYCEETTDYPTESRYRWTVEVTGLMKNFIERHPELVEKMLKLVHEDRIEICGFYLNMPTEVVGHEELIRCLYYAQRLRDEYGVKIDTAQINDVPGYTWSLADLLPEAGIRRVSFRANSIRGNFLWYREGAVRRPFYWEGPAGGKVFMWYTDTYRDGNFFRSPGLHEGSFLDNIRRNEANGYAFDYIQLRMGGDNLPPDLDASKNAKAWNEKYLWPRVIISTNREFLEPLERDYGQRCQTFRGDIPSWWADGPVSAAHENGMIRLLHDELVATEGLWTCAKLIGSNVAYPHEKLDVAYDKMLHFDEHTWGASGSISDPKSKETRVQWAFKKAFADDAKRLGDELRRDSVRALAKGLSSDKAAAATEHHVLALFNPLAWERTDIVALPLEGTPVAGGGGVRVVDTRNGMPVDVQMSADDRTAWFVAEKLPSLGYAVFEVSAGKAAGPETLDPKPELENRFYYLEASPQAGGLVSWRDKQLGRELLDRSAKYLGNQPIYERSLDGRDAISRKTPTRFERTVPTQGNVVRRTGGPVFDELVLETSLPTAPCIRQLIRLYHALKIVDIHNLVDKEEVFEPEGVYFAFPFNIPKPTMRVQIADASMRLGVDQLTYSCQDFYAIQHWLDAGGDGIGVIWTPLECPLITAGGMNAYQWADQIDFSKAHVFSWIMNNYWICNFKNGQSGVTPLRYRMTSYQGQQDPVRATQFAWQPFHPVIPIWLGAAPSANEWSFISVEGDPVVVSCVKTADNREDMIIRVLEMQGKPAAATLRLHVPEGRKVVRAYRANCLEVKQEELAILDDAVRLELKPHQIMTVGVAVE